MRKYGFSLIELLITIAIIGIISVIGGVNYSHYRASSRDNQRIADLSRIQSALVQRFTVEKAYPTTANFVSDLQGGYLNPLPKDPTTGAYYNYAVSGDLSSFAVWAKMEASNSKAVNDGGSHNNAYETGSGDDWMTLIPATLP